MVQLGKLECSICTEDGPCPEFAVPENDPNHDTEKGYPCKTVYISATEGKEYFVKFSAEHYTPIGEPKYDCFGLDVWIDGNSEDILYFTHPLWSDRRSKELERPPKVRTIKGIWRGDLLRKPKFSKLNVVERNENIIPDNILASIGEILVYVKRVDSSTARSSIPTPLDFELNHNDSICEKKSKHTLDKTVITSYSEPSKPTGRYLIGSIAHDTHQTPYSLFRFLYRAEGSLKNMGVIPRTPIPTPSPSLEDSMTREELLAEVKRLRDTGKDNAPKNPKKRAQIVIIDSDDEETESKKPKPKKRTQIVIIDSDDEETESKKPKPGPRQKLKRERKPDATHL